MQNIHVPWQKWIQEGDHELAFTDDWLLMTVAPPGVPDVGEEGVREALRAPVAGLPLAKLARGRRNAVIAVDDVSRPTPCYRVLPAVLQELAAGGIDHSQVRIVVASGAHRQSARYEIVEKMGREILDLLDVEHHLPYDNLVDLGLTKRGIRLRTNRTFYEGDLKIAVGSLMPHPTAGFGGGRKLVSVGLSARSTLFEFHNRDLGLCTGVVEGNTYHDDLEEMMHMVRLDFAVEMVLTQRGGVAGLCSGEPTACFLAAVDRAWDVYGAGLPTGVDIAVLNAYPKDYDLGQAVNVFGVAVYPNMEMIRPGGTMVLTAACPDGEGLHYLETSVPTYFGDETFQGRHIIIYSPNLHTRAVRRHFGPGVTNYQKWEDVLAELRARHGPGSRVAILPSATLILNPANRGHEPWSISIITSDPLTKSGRSA